MKNKLVNNSDDLATYLAEEGIETFPNIAPTFPSVVCISEFKVVGLVSKGEFYPLIAEAIEGIGKTLAWFSGRHNSGSIAVGDLPTCMKAQVYLAGHIETLGTELASAEAEKVAADHYRMRKRALLAQAYRAQGDTAADSERKARIDSEDVDKRLEQATRYVVELRSLYDTVKATLIALSQTIKQLQGDYDRLHLRE